MVKYFVSYNYGLGFGNFEIRQLKKIKSIKDVQEIRKAIETETGFKDVVILNYAILGD